MNIITIGIDLGTDKCCLTYQDKIGRPFIILHNDSFKIPSIIYNDIIPPISNIKRLIGHNANSYYAKTIANYYNWIITDDLINNDLIIYINNNKYSVEFLMCELLKKLKTIIIENIGDNFDVIITIPANFNEGQKNKILTYCKIVNINCKCLVYEPCSAALSYINYFHDIKDEELKRIVVFDFGAGTLDLAIVSCNSAYIDDKLEWMTKIEYNIGDNNLGGIDINIMLDGYLMNEYSKDDIEDIKIKLSNKQDTDKIKYLEYFKLLDDTFKHRIIHLLDNLHIYDITKFDIDIVLLIGGGCYNEWIRDLIQDYYNKEIQTFNLDLTNKLNTIKLDIRDIGVSLGATCYNKKFLKDNVLILTESIPLSICIETSNKMCKLIPKNTLIPCTTKKYFTTTEDNQTEIEIKLFQGDEEYYLLGNFIMDNLKSEPKGIIVVIINISITTDGLIIVEGSVKGTEKYNKKIIINRYNFNIN